MLTVAGVDPAAGIPVIDLAKPIAVTVTNPDGDRVALAFDVVGTTVGRHYAPLRPGGQGATATVRSPIHPYLMAGRLTAMVTVLRGQNVVATYRFAIQSTQPATTTALAITTVVLVLFALAFLESSMRALRQARDRVTAAIGVPTSAAALALAGLTAVWILTGRQPATETALGSAELAAAAGIAAVMGANRVGRAYRSRRSRRMAIARF
jgi:serine/threonine-protein kinase